MTCTHLMYSNFIPASALLSQTTVLNIVFKCLDTQILFVGFPIPPHLPLTCFWTAGCHLFHADWWQQGEHQERGKRLPTPLVPPRQCGSFQRGALGGTTATPKTSCIPRTQAAPICQLRYREHSRNPERARSTNGVTADGVFGEKHLPSSRILWLGKQLGFFSKQQLTYSSTLLLHLSSDQCPHWWASGPCTKAHNDRNHSQVVSDTGKNSMLWTAWPWYSEVNKSGFCLNCNVTAPPKGAQKSVRHTHLQEVLKAPGRADLLSYRILQLGV